MDASHLNTIPAELRNTIYELCFACDEVDIKSSQPALLSTCKQIRNEALSVSYYAPTAFSITIPAGPVNTSVINWLQADETRLRLALTQPLKLYTVVQGVSEWSWRDLLVALETAGFGTDRVDFLVPRVQAWTQHQQIASGADDGSITHIRLRTIMGEESSLYPLVSVEFLIHLRNLLRERTYDRFSNGEARDSGTRARWSAWEREKQGEPAQFPLDFSSDIESRDTDRIETAARQLRDCSQQRREWRTALSLSTSTDN
ncbi:hypothetical protein LTR56_014899 [Elasticomyces elasticus]|nr:hypothetical protein LTR22_021202 [Elasticomyces elasticus]KAK3635127.1 hypothetical protein LTR56_014899 [Elasticomyces elasticus]KAK4909295.1 hypothetical protein LTR49_021886 [Elasticomyces elasticus]KAK5749912.1 hypothetical protein LTS12_020058 [Elasticomyces elasticus]